MADKKMTKKEMWSLILVFLNAAEADETLIAGVEHEIELLDRKGSKKSVNATKVAEQNAAIALIADVLADATEPMKATPIGDAAGGMGVQRASAMLKKMVEAGTVVRTEDKGVAYFTLA